MELPPINLWSLPRQVEYERKMYEQSLSKKRCVQNIFNRPGRKATDTIQELLSKR